MKQVEEAEEIFISSTSRWVLPVGQLVMPGKREGMLRHLPSRVCDMWLGHHLAVSDACCSCNSNQLGPPRP
jgi:branched-subunit amino acid aminotransferase/4-amino-4-deoxychorismate lyase